MNGIDLIAVERQRHVSVEGWTPDHDAAHCSNELVDAARAYVQAATDIYYVHDHSCAIRLWPWDLLSFKPKNDWLRCLVKAGALIAAAIDRRIRMGGVTVSPGVQIELDMRAQERSLAYEYVSGLIESMTLEDEDGWLDTAEESLESYEIDGMQSSIGYLEWRGLIERHPEKPNLIKVRDESEASR